VLSEQGSAIRLELPVKEMLDLRQNLVAANL